MIASFRALIALLLFVTPSFAQLEAFGFDEPKADQVKPSLVADTTAIVPGKPFTVLLRMDVLEGWHIYWQSAGDIGLPPKITWQLPEGFKADPIQWPIPSIHKSEGDFVNYVHEHDVLLPITIHPPAHITASEQTLKGELFWQVCKEQCIQGEGNVSLTLPVAQEAQPANQELFTTARGRLPKTDAPPFKVTWNVKPEAYTVDLEGLTPETNVEFFPLPAGAATPAVAQVAKPDASGKRQVKVPVKSGGSANTPWQGLVVAKQADGKVAGWMIAAPAASSGATGADAGPAPEGGEVGPASGGINSLPIAIGMAFLGGLILNLMPCVLPVIALKIFSFVSQAGEHPERVFRLGLAFVAGVFVFFLALAGVAIGLHAAGSQFEWGAQFADPRLALILISLVVIFALVMFGTFEITLGGTAENTLGALSRKEGYGGAFVHGLFTTLLGTSCTAPLVGPVLGFAVAQSAPVIVLIFLSMAAGMSLPYFLLTWKPAWMRYLPKPGAWMERFKQLMGFVLLAVAVWLLGVLGKSRGPEPMAAAIWFLVILSLGAWIFGAGHRRWWATILAIGVVAAGGYMFIPSALAKTKGVAAAHGPNEVGINWEPFSEGKVEEYIAAGTPLFIDFTADWCLNCKTNEKLVINTQPVADALKAKKVVTVEADYTDRDPVIRKWLRKYKRIGVPVYVLYRPGEATPVVFSEILTQGALLEEINKIP